MKNRFISIILLICVFLNLTGCKADKMPRLICNTNGEFTILIVADPQCDTKTEWQQAQTELETLVKRAKPNFVLINGDMNTNNIIPADMWELFISPLTERGINWATTNGNHDPFTKRYYDMYKSYNGCLNNTVPKNDPNYEPSRPMNYVIPIYANDNRTIVFAIYGMDSGTSNNFGYEGLTQKQINWYKKQSQKLKKQNGGKAVTSILCMHIPLPEVIDLYHSGEYTTYGIANEPNAGTQNYTCENGKTITKTKLHTTAKKNDNKTFAQILKQGDVKAIIFGHDHRTNFAGSYKGVILGFAGKLSTGCYSDDLCRGGRVIKFNQQNPQDFTVSWLGSIKTSTDQPPIYTDGTIKN